MGLGKLDTKNVWDRDGNRREKEIKRTRYEKCCWKEKIITIKIGNGTFGDVSFPLCRSQLKT